MEVQGGDNSTPLSLFLPDEIITNILKQRLPVKSLIRFQCVCKHWKYLVNSQSFIAEHLLHYPINNESPSLVFEQRGAHPLDLFLADCEMRGLIDVCNPSPFGYNKPVPMIIGTCKGLICVKSPSRSYASLGTYNFFLWNPATREVGRVPQVIHHDDFEPSYFGFGFCPIVNDFKIVKISKNLGMRVEVNGFKMVKISNTLGTRVEVYSLKTNSWREIEFENISGNIIGQAVVYPVSYVNGFIFWNMWKSGVGREDERIIVWFDTTMEVLTSIPAPASASNSCFGYKVIGHDNKIVLLELGGTEYDVWVLEESVDSSDKKWGWTKIDDSNPCWSNISTDDHVSAFLSCSCDYVESLVHPSSH